MRKTKGFTLIELIIVIVIVGILAAVAVPKFIDIVDEAKSNATKAALGGIRSALEMYYASSALTGGGGSYPTGTGGVEALVSGDKIPVNAVTGKNTMEYTSVVPSGATNPNRGWYYGGNGGVTRGQVWAANNYEW